MSAFSDSSFFADDYLRSRPQYPSSLFEYIFLYHQKQQQVKRMHEQQRNQMGLVSDNGNFNINNSDLGIMDSLRQPTRALDVACGPGEATVPLSKYFDEVIGIDPSEVMVQTAKKIHTNGYPKVTFSTGSAENFLDVNSVVGPGGELPLESGNSENFPDQPFKIPRNSLDFISAAEGAHWFNLPRFYHNASEALKPGGTLAIWGYCNHVYEGPGNPYQLEVAADIQHRYLYGSEYLGPYWQQPGRDILQDLMIGSEPQVFSPAARQQQQQQRQNLESNSSQFIHVERHDNVATALYPKIRRPKSEMSHPSNAFIMKRVLHLLDVDAYLRTSSAYHKWKKANPAAPSDILTDMMNEIKRVTGWHDSTVVTIVYDTFLILATKAY